ncbi:MULTISPECIES: DUF2141 domain-containing protein [Pseudomonas]|uniref:DUF2141 domain-containing protein n=1 Tax=Pseudomonas TaxID=286 RepID=UPI00257DC851|nr:MULTISPECIES: DUF2141 domain-containing protein [Pseudomonas]
MALGGTVFAGDIRLILEGRQKAGDVHVALLPDDSEEWAEQPLRTLQGNEAVLVLREVPAGRYAVQVYQDLDGNGQLNLSPRGLPLEPVGFSGNPSLLSGKPRPEECLLTHGERDSVLSIRLQSRRQ